MPGAGEAEARGARRRARRRGLRSRSPSRAAPITVGASASASRCAPRDGADPTQLMKCADLALYRAKAEGRDGFRFFAPAMDAAMQARQRLELDLRDALERAEFRLLYQPVVRLADGRVVGYEALLRWTHPTQGDIPPETFIAIAEETPDDRPDRRLGAGARLRRRGAAARRTLDGGGQRLDGAARPARLRGAGSARRSPPPASRPSGWCSRSPRRR